MPDSFAERIERRRLLFLAEVQRQGWWLSPDERIGERDAAKLLGYSHPDSLRNARRRCREDWPRIYRIGGNGNKITYTLSDLAEHVERQTLTSDERANISTKVNRGGYADLRDLPKIA